MNKCEVIAVCNQKGGVGKTTTAVNLGAKLARQGKKVCLIDMDPQGSLTISLGYKNPDELECTVSDAFKAVISEKSEGIDPVIVIEEHIDLIPSNIELCSIEVGLVNEMSRERVLATYINDIKDKYDYILIDCMPSLGMLTINALCAADKVLIPTQPEYLSAKGLEQLLKTVGRVKKRMNPDLQIAGIVLTMADSRTNLSKSVIESIRNNYGEHIKVFNTVIPRSVRAAEAGAAGMSIFRYDPLSKVALSYSDLTKEVMNLGKEPRDRSDSVR